jgi:hypothetical protein
MSRELDKLRQSIINAAEQDTKRVPVPLARPGSLFNFRYSYTEVSSHGGNLNVRMKQTQFQDGKLTSEECEGTLDRRAYDAVTREAQEEFLNQVGQLMRLFWLPFSGRGRRRDE